MEGDNAARGGGERPIIIKIDKIIVKSMKIIVGSTLKRKHGGRRSKTTSGKKKKKKKKEKKTREEEKLKLMAVQTGAREMERQRVRVVDTLHENDNGTDDGYETDEAVDNRIESKTHQTHQTDRIRDRNIIDTDDKTNNIDNRILACIAPRRGDRSWRLGPDGEVIENKMRLGANGQMKKLKRKCQL